MNEGQQTGYLSQARASVVLTVCRGDPRSDLTPLLNAKIPIVGPGLLMQAHPSRKD